MLAVTLVVSLIAAQTPGSLTILVGLAVLAIAFYVVPTRVHERYAYPVFALAIILAAVAWRWRIAYVAITGDGLPEHVRGPDQPVLQQPGDQRLAGDRPGPARRVGRRSDRSRERRHLPVGGRAAAPDARWPGCAARLAAEQELAWDEDWVAVRASPGRRRWAAASLSPAPVGGSAARPAAAAGRHAVGATTRCTCAAASAAAAAAPMAVLDAAPDARRVGVVGWLKARFNELPIRPDRSATLRHEGGGRLDRLDLFLVVLLSSGRCCCARSGWPSRTRCTSTRSTTRGPRPNSSRRGATACRTTSTNGPTRTSPSTRWPAGSWRSATTRSTPRATWGCRSSRQPWNRAARRARAGRTGAGERLHIATGTEIRTYDLVTRDLISTFPAEGATALAIDDTGNQLVIGYGDGRIATLGLDLIDTETAPAAGSRRSSWYARPPVDHLMVVSDGTTLAAASSTP